MQFVRVSGANNRPDRNGVGCVPHEYEIARCAISNADWCEFLNAAGERAVKLGLWHKDMATGVLGGIDRVLTSGETPLLHFSVKPGWAKKPVTYITYTGVMRYCNWLMTGDTEKGAYDLSVAPPRRLEDATYFLPTDDEWYKAAYYDCSIVRLFGLSDWLIGKGGYWKYPTRSNEIPLQDQANFERGDRLSPLALKVCPNESNNRTIEQSNNYFYLADVDAFADSPSPCGALQMGGNVWEFLEDCFQNPLGNKLRGGSFGYTETGLSAANVDFGKYDKRCYVFGARICRMKDGWHHRYKPLRFGIILSIRGVVSRVLWWIYRR